MATRFPDKNKQPKNNAPGPARPTPGSSTDAARSVATRVAPLGGGPQGKTTKVSTKTGLPHSKAEMRDLRQQVNQNASQPQFGMAPSRGTQNDQAALARARQENMIAARQQQMQRAANQAVKRAMPAPAAAVPPRTPNAPSGLDPAAATAAAAPGAAAPAVAADPSIQGAIDAATAARAQMSPPGAFPGRGNAYGRIKRAMPMDPAYRAMISRGAPTVAGAPVPPAADGVATAPGAPVAAGAGQGGIMQAIQAAQSQPLDRTGMYRRPIREPYPRWRRPMPQTAQMAMPAGGNMPAPSPVAPPPGGTAATGTTSPIAAAINPAMFLG